MATVFLAKDSKQANRAVAIKVLRPELASALGPDRFLQEIRVTAALQHPHILPLFDSGSVDSLPYYVMPWVEGESLRERLDREKQLTIEDALRITADIADALEYAHAHGVIHRDVKPENVLLSGSQAILADFGIARAVAELAGEKLTATGIAIGTPAYMSPEQSAASHAIDARSDIYSLACVLYEMLVGDPPFTGSSVQAIAARKSVEPARTMRTVRDTVPEGLDRVVLRALARVPADRYATAASFSTALAEAAREAPSPRRTGRTRTVAARLGIIIVAAVAVAFIWLSHSESNPRRVLVTPFENQTGDASLSAIGEITADWLIRELQATGLVEVVDQRVLASAVNDTTLERVAEIARGARAGTVVSLAYYRLSDSVRFQARITEASSGATLYTPAPRSAPLDSPLEPLAALGKDVVDGVATLVAPGVEWRASGDHPPSFTAYKEFVAGTDILSHLDFDRAIQHWFRAARLDTTFSTPLLAAASFMLVSGQNARADSLVTTLERRRDRLRISERQRLDNLSARIRGNIPAALAALRPLAERAPLSEAAWEVALHELWLNRPSEAISSFEQLDPHWEFLRGWWFYWTFYCSAYHLSDDYVAELSLARRGRNQYPNSIRVAEPQIAALAAIGRTDELFQLLQDLSAMPPEEPGDFPRVLMIAAAELRAHGQSEASDTVFRRAIELIQALSLPANPHTAQSWLPPTIAYLSGRLDDAFRGFSELVARDRTDINAQGHLGAIAARRGERSEALRISGWLEHLDRPYLYGYGTLWRARIAALLGERERALTLLHTAFGEGLKHVGTFTNDAPARTFGPWLHRDPDFESVRDSPEFQRLMRGAR
jgi:tetratricopeptide (TPR) repeat protein/TolB-like protein